MAEDRHNSSHGVNNTAIAFEGQPAGSLLGLTLKNCMAPGHGHDNTVLNPLVILSKQRGRSSTESPPGDAPDRSLATCKEDPTQPRDGLRHANARSLRPWSPGHAKAVDRQFTKQGEVRGSRNWLSPLSLDHCQCSLCLAVAAAHL